MVLCFAGKCARVCSEKYSVTMWFMRGAVRDQSRVVLACAPWPTGRRARHGPSMMAVTFNFKVSKTADSHQPRKGRIPRIITRPSSSHNSSFIAGHILSCVPVQHLEIAAGAAPKARSFPHSGHQPHTTRAATLPVAGPTSPTFLPPAGEILHLRLQTLLVLPADPLPVPRVAHPPAPLPYPCPCCPMFPRPLPPDTAAQII